MYKAVKKDLRKSEKKSRSVVLGDSEHSRSGS